MTALKCLAATAAALVLSISAAAACDDYEDEVALAEAMKATTLAQPAVTQAAPEVQTASPSTASGSTSVAAAETKPLSASTAGTLRQ